MSEIPTIALTGGPSGGKSTLLRALTEQSSGVYCVAEAATILLSGGYPAPGEQHGWTQEWQRDFQTAVAAAQIGLEHTASARASQEDKKIMVCDRGLPDGAAYLLGGMKELEEITGCSEEAMLSAYQTVLHLPSSAVRGVYDKASNPHRFEEAGAALELEGRILEAWRNHPNRIILDMSHKADRVAQGLQIITSMIE